MKIQCSPHTIYDDTELLLRTVNRITGFRIVIGEPGEDNFEKFKLELLNLGKEFRIIQESNGETLLHYLSAQFNSRQLPDLILLNQNMTAVDGTETLDLIGRNETLSTIPTIVYRLYSDQRLETVLISRGKQDRQLSGFIYTDMKSFIVDLNQFMLQTLPGSGSTVVRNSGPEFKLNNLCQ